MAQYLLTKIAKKHYDWAIRTATMRGNSRAPFVEAQEKFDIVGYGDGYEYMLPYIILPNTTKEFAEEYAKQLAEKTIGYTWYVSEICSGMVAPPSDVVKLEVSEKGILPA